MFTLTAPLISTCKSGFKLHKIDSETRVAPSVMINTIFNSSSVKGHSNIYDQFKHLCI